MLSEKLAVPGDQRFRQGLRLSKLPHHKTLDEYDFSFQPELDLRKVEDLAPLSFVGAKPNAALLGPPGVGNIDLADQVKGDQGYVQGYAAAPGGGEPVAGPRMDGAGGLEEAGDLTGGVRAQRHGAADRAQVAVVVISAEVGGSAGAAMCW
ncbi:hypothetical protein GCM10010272_54060 [Streptomyces lateritius]|nr:hypothetical protein GCM10010272_54060 [Streptomyces lateritius]